MKLILDASVAVAAARINEPFHQKSKALVARILGGIDDAIVPVIFPIEVGASLARVGEDAGVVRKYVDALLNVMGDMTGVGSLRARQIRDVAIDSRLRAADAMYVWLAMREQVPLVTLDRELIERGSSFCKVIEP